MIRFQCKGIRLRAALIATGCEGDKRRMQLLCVLMHIPGGSKNSFNFKSIHYLPTAHNTSICKGLEKIKVQNIHHSRAGVQSSPCYRPTSKQVDETGRVECDGMEYLWECVSRTGQRVQRNMYHTVCPEPAFEDSLQ